MPYKTLFKVIPGHVAANSQATAHILKTMKDRDDVTIICGLANHVLCDDQISYSKLCECQCLKIMQISPRLLNLSHFNCFITFKTLLIVSPCHKHVLISQTRCQIEPVSNEHQ